MGIARQFETQQTHYRTVNFNDAGIASGVLLGTVPSGSVILHVRVLVTTAFNAGTTNVLQGGTTGTGTNLFTSTDAAAGTAGPKIPANAANQAGGLVITQDQDLFVSYTQTGTAATAGSATIVVEFVPLSNGG
jgi:hypothetical protein